MTIHMGKINIDQVGANGFARQLYAYPILAMSILVFTRGYQMSDTSWYVLMYPPKTDLHIG